MRVKEDKCFGRRYFLSGVFYFFLVLFLVSAGVWLYRYNVMASVPVFLMGGIFFCIGAICEARKLRRYKCPACGKRLSLPDVVPDEKIIYTCEDCQIKWDVGLTHPHN